MADRDTESRNGDEFEQELHRHGLRDPNGKTGLRDPNGKTGLRDPNGKTGLRDPNEVEPDEKLWNVWRILGFGTIALMTLFWVWAFSPFAPDDHPDKLEDSAFPDAAEPLCEAAVNLVDALPKANEVRDMDGRAALIEQSTAVFDEMLVQLRTLAPPPGTHDGDLVNRWLTDWETYLGDRYDYAADFRAGIDEAFTVTRVSGGQVTDPIDQFASVNKMADCASPQDV